MIISNVEQILNFIEKNDILAFDIETTGLNPRKDVIIGFGVSNDVEGMYMPLLSYNGQTLEEVFPKETCKLVLNSLASKKLITWNGSFDLRFVINNLNVNLIEALWSDGMLAKHTCFEEGHYGLKETAKELYGIDSNEEAVELKGYLTRSGAESTQFYKAPTEILARYCVKDCILTYKINQHYLNIMKEKDLLSFFFDDEVMPLYKEVTIPMELNGVPVDVELMQKSKKEIELELSNLEQKILNEIKPLLPEFETWYLDKEFPVSKSGSFVQKVIEFTNTPLPKLKSGSYSLTQKAISTLSPDSFFYKWYTNDYFPFPKLLKKEIQLSLQGDKPMFNLLSKHHLKKLFFDKMNLEASNYTDKGNPQVDETFLESIKEQYPWVKDLITYNKLTKIKGTYIDRFLEEQENGIFYPKLFQHRTVSGRQSGDLQQLPRPMQETAENAVVAKYNNRIRQFFKAKDGFVFVGADYESLEPHIFAHISGDKKLQDIFNKGHDFYSTIAIDTEGLTEYSPDKKAENYLGKLNKEKRQTAKAYALGIPYGMTGYKLAFELNIPQKKAEQLVSSYLNAYPDLKSWISETHKKVCNLGFIKIESGRYRNFPRAVQLYNKYGNSILDDLELWKKYNETPNIYKQAKLDRREFKNYLNNACNVQIQGLAASIVSRAAIKINKELKLKNISAYIALAVHDELVVLCQFKDGAKVAEIMKNVMENIWNLSVKLKAEPAIGITYSETKD